MIVARTAHSHSLNRLSFQIRRWIASSHATSSAENVTAEAERRKPTVTKVNFSELPKGRVLPDGSMASPIGEWLGGLEESCTAHEFQTAAADAEELKPKRKRRSRKAEETSKGIDELIETSKKATRKRRPRQAENGSETIDEMAEIPKQTGRKRRSKAETESEGIDNTVKLTKKPTRKTGPKDSEDKPKKAKKIKAETEPEDASMRPSDMLGGVIKENQKKFPHCILLTRVGQFYESYFEQAPEVAKLLNIKITSRPYQGIRVPMCGFPLVHLDKSLKALVQQNKRFVAMCEEFPRFVPGESKVVFDRRVTRVITPGTLIDEQFLNPYENNYLLSVGISPTRSSTADIADEGSNHLGLAWIDVSTGEFFAKDATVDEFRDELARIGPREVVLDSSWESTPDHPIRSALSDEGIFVSFAEPSNAPTLEQSSVSGSYSDDLTSPSESESDSIPTLTTLTVHEVAAISLLTAYLQTHLLEHMPTLSSPSREHLGNRMQIDSHTIRALEIRDGATDGTTKGSLLSVIKRTVTTSGTRLLARWLCSPSTSTREIHARQSLVAFLHSRPHLRDDILQALTDMEDTSRIVQRFLLGRGDTSDLAAIRSTILLWSVIKKRFDLERKMEQSEKGVIDDKEWSSLNALLHRMSDLSSLAGRINLAISRAPAADASEPDVVDNEEDQVLPSTASSTETKGVKTKYIFNYGQNNWTIKPEFSEHLMKLHVTHNDLVSAREQLERELQRNYDVASLTLRSSPGLGMFVHIGNSKRDGKRLPAPVFVNVAQSASTSSFFHQPWSVLGSQLVDAANAITAAEKETFDLLRREVNAFSTELRRNSRIMDELDATLSFANLATEMNFIRPTLKDENTFAVINGRHPTVELGLMRAGRVFTPNSLTLSPDSRVHIITGPNMAGKSTYLRQTALVTILAQTGSFVPADYAAIGIVDKLFSRVGAKDDLFRDRSTFMVEMLETADILKRATPRSLVIMDEVGRGTTVKDGLAIAFAAVHHLVTTNRCRTLFATHFHELADMLGYSGSGQGQGVFEVVEFHCTDVDETDDGHFAYSHRMRPGVNRDSHGLKVAQLAGMPDSAVAVAKEALSLLRETSSDETLATAKLTAMGQALSESPRS